MLAVAVVVAALLFILNAWFVINSVIVSFSLNIFILVFLLHSLGQSFNISKIDSWTACQMHDNYM